MWCSCIQMTFWDQSVQSSLVHVYNHQCLLLLEPKIVRHLLYLCVCAVRCLNLKQVCWMMTLYKEAARIFKLVESKQGSAKNLTLSSTYKVCVCLLVVMKYFVSQISLYFLKLPLVIFWTELFICCLYYWNLSGVLFVVCEYVVE